MVKNMANERKQQQKIRPIWMILLGVCGIAVAVFAVSHLVKRAQADKNSNQASVSLNDVKVDNIGEVIKQDNANRVQATVEVMLSDCAVAVGTTFKAVAVVTPAGTEQALIWSSNNTGVFEVTQDGIVTVKGVGTAVLTATVGTVSDAVAIEGIAQISDGSSNNLPIYDVAQGGSSSPAGNTQPSGNGGSGSPQSGGNSSPVGNTQSGGNGNSSGNTAPSGGGSTSSGESANNGSGAGNAGSSGNASSGGNTQSGGSSSPAGNTQSSGNGGGGSSAGNMQSGGNTQSGGNGNSSGNTVPSGGGSTSSGESANNGSGAGNSGSSGNTSSGGNAQSGGSSSPAGNTQSSGNGGGDSSTGNMPSGSQTSDGELQGADSTQIGGYLPDYGFDQMLSNVYECRENGVYYGQIVTQPNNTIVYIMRRSGSFDAQIQEVLARLLPKEHGQVWNTYLTAATDTTFTVEDRMVRIVMAQNGGHSQIVIYNL